MKVIPALLGMLLVLPASSLIRAQTTEKIALYADRAGTDCSISDTGAGVTFVYMIHEGTGQRLGAEFRAPVPECWAGATWVGESLTAFVFSGSTQGTGLSVSYGVCSTLPVYIGRMIIEVTGDGESCCRYPVRPILSWPLNIHGVGCLGDEYSILGGSVVINENASCPCAPPLAVNSTTWGQIKSLYY